MNRKKLLILVLVICIVSLNFVSAFLIDNLISYWKLDETSGDVVDSHGTNHGTNHGATRGVTGKINNAFDFDGSNDYVNTNYDFQEDYISVSIWAKLDSVTGGTQRRFIANWDGNGFSIMHGGNAGDGSSFYIGTSGGVDNVNTGSDLNTGQWYHIVVTYDGTDMKYYLDGELYKTKTHTYGGPISSSTGNVIIGCYPSIDKYFFDGKIDEAGIWNRVLSSTEVSDLYNSGDGLGYPFAVDTCSCPGAGNNWEIDMSDYCNITSDCDLTTGKLNFTGSGETRINATITTTDLGDPGTNGILRILSDCLIWVI